MAESDLSKSPLHDRHVAMDARMGPDGGWEMPLSYRGATEEVEQTRARAGVFDISHVGRIRIRGDEALELVERACTADVIRQEDDTALLTLLCNESGGVIDQCAILRLENCWLLNTSPINREKVLAHLRALGEGMSVRIDDQTPGSALFCVAGAEAETLLGAALPVRVAGMAPGQVKTGSFMIARYIALRSESLGVWALEVMVPKMLAGQAWRFVTDKAGENAVAPAGMTARDVLRIEAGRCRYGHELNETIDPFTAGLGHAVDFDHDFLGRGALESLRDKPTTRRRVGLVLEDTGIGGPIPRLGDEVFDSEGKAVGSVTSGTFSPVRGRIVAMAYVTPDAAAEGGELRLGVEPDRPALVVGLPIVPPT
jgi:glycine cleavage system T protein (aminomethyltransferase)